MHDAKVGLCSRLRGCSNALVDTVLRFADVHFAGCVNLCFCLASLFVRLCLFICLSVCSFVRFFFYGPLRLKQINEMKMR